MRNKLYVLLFLTGWCILTASAVRAEEELFDAKSAAQHTDAGIKHLFAKKYDAAIEEFEKSVDINPDAEAFYLLGYAYYLKGKSGDGESRLKARENFEKAYELDPNYTPGRVAAPPEAVGTARPAEQQGQPATAEEPGENAAAENRAGTMNRGPVLPEQPSQQTTQTPPPSPEPSKEQQPPAQQEQQPPAQQPPAQQEQPKSY